MSECVSGLGPEGRFEMYTAMPTSHSGPAVIVVHEIYGPTSYMRYVCDELAKYGCIAGCPNLFWRVGPKRELGHDYDSWREATRLEDQFDREKGYCDLDAARHFLLSESGCTGKSAIVGHCLGGLYAYLFAARSDVNCAVAYYPVGIENMVDEAANVDRPLLIHMPENEFVIGRQGQDRIRQALSFNNRVTFYDYPGTTHGFARIQGQNYHVMSAETADLRTKAFLQRYLF